MIHTGRKYRITTPVNSCHIVGVGDIIEITGLSQYGVHSMDISVNSEGNPYNGILMFEGPYSAAEYWEKVEMCLEAV